MANGTTTLEEEEFTLPPPERVGEEHGSLTAIVQELVYTVDHKKLGLMSYYIRAAVLCRCRHHGHPDARSALCSE